MQIIPINDTNDPSFLADEQTAINIYESLFSYDNITVTIRIGYGDMDGQPLPDQNKSEGDVNILGVQFLTYAALRNDLMKYGEPLIYNNSNLPPPGGFVGPDGTTNPPNFWVSSAVAKIFGIQTNVAIDGSVGIGTGFAPGPERVSALLHEIGHALGRVPENFSDPLYHNTSYSELDLWRFTSQGNRLFDSNTTTPTAAYFSVDGGIKDLADWGQTSDSTDFRGTDSTPPSNLTPNDPFDEIVGDLGNFTGMDGAVMAALGFNFTVVIIQNDPTIGQITVPHPTLKLEASRGERFSASSLFIASGLPGDPITQYGLWNSGRGGGHFVLNGVVRASNQEIDVPASQLGELSYQSGTGVDTLRVRIGNSTNWSDWSESFTVAETRDTGPVVTPQAADVSAAPDQLLPALSLFTASDPFGDPITRFTFRDTGSGGGHFVLDGVVQPTGRDIAVTAEQLPQLSYQAGSGTDTLRVRVSDGGDKSPWSRLFTVSATPATGPAVPPTNTGLSSITSAPFATDASSFNGTVASLGGQQAGVFTDIGPFASSMLGYGGNDNSTPAGSDATHGTNIALLSNYMAFVTASDGNGEMPISTATISSEQYPIAPSPGRQ
jgi:hypothetical protein